MKPLAGQPFILLRMFLLYCKGREATGGDNEQPLPLMPCINRQICLCTDSRSLPLGLNLFLAFLFPPSVFWSLLPFSLPSCKQLSLRVQVTTFLQFQWFRSRHPLTYYSCISTHVVICLPHSHTQSLVLQLERHRFKSYFLSQSACDLGLSLLSFVNLVFLTWKKASLHLKSPCLAYLCDTCEDENSRRELLGLYRG